MKKLLITIILALLFLQYTSAAVSVEYSVKINNQFTWKLDYYQSEGRDNEMDEIVINGTINSKVTEVSNKGVFADLLVFQTSDENLTGKYGLLSLLESNFTAKDISISGNITDIVHIQYEEIVPFIWPNNQAFWEMMGDNFNKTETTGFESSEILLKESIYTINQFEDKTAVDGPLVNASIKIDYYTGLMLEMVISSKAFFTINPPVISLLKIYLVLEDYIMSAESAVNPLIISGMNYYLIIVVIFTYRNRNKLIIGMK